MRNPRLKPLSQRLNAAAKVRRAERIEARSADALNRAITAQRRHLAINKAALRDRYTVDGGTGLLTALAGMVGLMGSRFARRFTR